MKEKKGMISQSTLIFLLIAALVFAAVVAALFKLNPKLIGAIKEAIGLTRFGAS